MLGVGQRSIRTMVLNIVEEVAKDCERWAASAFTFPHDLLIENRWRDKSVPRSQHILCNCTNSVKRRMDVDDRRGLITVLNKITWLGCFGCMCQQECDQRSSWRTRLCGRPHQGNSQDGSPSLGLGWLQALVSLWRTDAFVAATSSSGRSVSAVERII